MCVMTLCEVWVDIQHRQAVVHNAVGLYQQPWFIAWWHSIMHVHLREHLHALHTNTR